MKRTEEKLFDILTAFTVSFVIAAIAITLVHCSSSQVQVAATIEDTTARAWNTIGEPALVHAYDEDLSRARVLACPDPQACSLASQEAAMGIVRAHWSPVWIALHDVTLMHETYRVALEHCRALDAGTCDVDYVAIGLQLAVHSMALRCALTAVNHPELDPGAGPMTCRADGGAL